jgi:DNA (cytosine-5)-methyltransferase 1
MRNFRYTLEDLKNKSEQKLFTYATTFAGGGGSSCGYKLSGGDCKFMNEFQEVACDTYIQNFPGTPYLCKDIKKMSSEEVMITGNFKPRELDIFDGSPPCPPFSMSGIKQKGWNKTQMKYGHKQTNIEDLTWEIIRLCKDIQPKVIVCENVKGLTMSYAIDHLNKMVKDFESIGYTTTYKVMSGVNYGVPQKRERVFIVSIRNDVLEDVGLNFMTINNVFPEPIDEDLSIRTAIADLQDNEFNKQEAEELREYMKKTSKYKWLVKLPKNPNRVMSVGDDVVTPHYQELYEKGEIKKEEIKNSFFQSRRVPWNQASHTLLETGLQPSVAAHLHPGEDRVFTTKEAGRLMTLPDDFILTGKLGQRLARIGLMVAPLQMHYLSKSIYSNVLKPYKEKHNDTNH